METFEIRILSPAGLPLLLVELPYMSAQAAVAAGRRMAKARNFEVWNDTRCVFTSRAPRSLRIVDSPPDPPAA